MVTGLRPGRGGFILPFGTGWFIRELLLGHGPEGSPTIDPARGAPQADMFYEYKLALHRAYARDATAWENDRRAQRGEPLYTEEEYTDRVEWYLRRIPYKLVKCRYHSFSRYFHWLKQLGWVEFTGEEEGSSIQDNYPPAPPRRYYRLTRAGTKAPDWEWSRPQLVLYPSIGGEKAEEYFARKRKERKYTKKVPTKRRAKK